MTSSQNAVSALPEPPASAPAPTWAGRLPGLDVLRGLAIVLVLFHNLSVAENGHSLAFKLWNVLPASGWIGVQIFFVLSGFLITGILADDKGRPRFYRTFYIRRALRIFPLYYALLVVVGLLHAVGVVRFPLSPLTALAHATYLQNWSALLLPGIPGFGHLWSLAVEEQFYVLWPFLIASFSLQGSTVACLVVIAASFLGRMAMHLAHLDPAWLYLSTPARADALALGALIALLLRSPVWRPRLIRALPWVAGVAGLALAVLLVRLHGFNRVNPLMQVYGYTLIAVLAAVATARVALAGPRAPRWPGAGPLTFFGKYSYAIYVVHMPIKVAAIALLGDRLRQQSTLHPLLIDAFFVGGGTVISVALALATWRFIEWPFLSLKDRIAVR